MNINDIKLFVEGLAKKNQSGNTITPTQFNLYCDRASMQLFTRDFNKWLSTGDASDFLSVFIKAVPLSISTNGNADYPADFQHINNVKKYYVDPNVGSGDWVEVRESTTRDWAIVVSSKLLPPTQRYPKFVEKTSSIEFRPIDPGLIQLEYFRRPIAPIWAYTTPPPSNRPVYDPINSVQFEALEYCLNEIMGILLGFYGITLSSQEISAWTQQVIKPENA